MFSTEFSAAAMSAQAKTALLRRNPVGFWISSMLAGFFVGFGVILSNVAAALAGGPAGRIVAGLSFGVALSLVVVAGAELFTGNVFVLTAGMFQKTCRPLKALALLAVCYAANLAGSIVLALLYHGTGLNTGNIAVSIALSAATKMQIPFPALFLRAVLCNMLVCLAVWCGFRLKSESAKLIMIFWCIFAFVAPGFEHSVANMTLLSVALLNPAGQAGLSVGGALYHLLGATLGNIVGGALFVAVPYALIARKKE